MNDARTVTIEVELSVDEIEGLENLNLLNMHASIAIEKICEEFHDTIRAEDEED